MRRQICGADRLLGMGDAKAQLLYISNEVLDLAENKVDVKAPIDQEVQPMQIELTPLQTKRAQELQHFFDHRQFMWPRSKFANLVNSFVIETAKLCRNPIFQCAGLMADDKVREKIRWFFGLAAMSLQAYDDYKEAKSLDQALRDTLSKSVFTGSGIGSSTGKLTKSIRSLVTTSKSIDANLETMKNAHQATVANVSTINDNIGVLAKYMQKKPVEDLTKLREEKKSLEEELVKIRGEKKRLEDENRTRPRQSPSPVNRRRRRQRSPSPHHAKRRRGSTVVQAKRCWNGPGCMRDYCKFRH